MDAQKRDREGEGHGYRFIRAARGGGRAAQGRWEPATGCPSVVAAIFSNACWGQMNAQSFHRKCREVS